MCFFVSHLFRFGDLSPYLPKNNYLGCLVFENSFESFPGTREPVRSFADIRRISAPCLSSTAVGMRASLRLCLPASPVNSSHYFSDIFVCSFQGTEICVGALLLSRAVSSQVPSAAQVLTIVFGMGTGVSPKRITTGNIEHLARFSSSLVRKLFAVP